MGLSVAEECLRMMTLEHLLQADGLAAPLATEEAQAVAEQLGQLAGLVVYPESITACDGGVYFLGRRQMAKHLGILAWEPRVLPAGGGWLIGRALATRSAESAVAGRRLADAVRFVGQKHTLSVQTRPAALIVCPADHTNAQALRAALPFVAPRPLGLHCSIGCGDRLGLATPGHVCAVRRGRMAPVLAQQSIRELTRTQRTPEEVLDAASWGAFQTGWRVGFGADADHLKTTEDLDRCAAASYTFYTIDPGDHVDDSAEQAEPSVVREKVESLPWAVLETTPQDLRRAYLTRPLEVEGGKIVFDEERLWRAAAKYGRAIAHTVTMYRHLSTRMEGRSFELEVSVDETESPTTPEQHYFIASQLQRLGVHWISLAPRFIGRFEKGVDYIGDLAAFEADTARQAAVARALGPYKLGLHSGSDKFSVYPILARLAGQLVHLKTAGTSYLEALRVVANVEPALFRQIAAFAIQRYAQDSRSYHVSADPSRLSPPDQLTDPQLASWLDSRDGRQVLHVTFGSVLTAQGPDGTYLFRDRFLSTLRLHEASYYAALAAHFERHIAPFT